MRQVEDTGSVRDGGMWIREDRGRSWGDCRATVLLDRWHIPSLVPVLGRAEWWGNQRSSLGKSQPLHPHPHPPPVLFSQLLTPFVRPVTYPKGQWTTSAPLHLSCHPVFSAQCPLLALHQGPL
jgi:hypothetical protein